jgi:hypothetical protein
MCILRIIDYQARINQYAYTNTQAHEMLIQLSFLWATCCLICFIPIVKPCLTHWSWLWFVHFIWNECRAHGGCDRSTGYAYSSMAPDPTSDIFRGPCTPILWFVFSTGLIRLITVWFFFLPFHLRFYVPLKNVSLKCFLYTVMIL